MCIFCFDIQKHISERKTLIIVDKQLFTFISYHLLFITMRTRLTTPRKLLYSHGV